MSVLSMQKNSSCGSGSTHCTGRLLGNENHPPGEAQITGFPAFVLLFWGLDQHRLSAICTTNRGAIPDVVEQSSASEPGEPQEGGREAPQPNARKDYCA